MFNRRYIMQRLEEEITRCQRQGNPLTVIALDLDCFKHINDEHGHAVGDHILRIFGEQLKRGTRGSYLAARYGGGLDVGNFSVVSDRQILAAVYTRMSFAM